jgi:hypothetical protein
MSRCSLTAVFCLASITTVIAQQGPDFSGEWKLSRQASTLSPIVAPAAQSGFLRIEHHEPKFAAHQTIVLDGKPFESNSGCCRTDVKLPPQMTGDAGPCPRCAGTRTR